MKQKTVKALAKVPALALALALFIGLMGGALPLRADTPPGGPGEGGPCPNHSAHEPACGYAAAVAGRACGHTHEVNGTEGGREDPQAGGEGCGYAAGRDAAPCAHAHTEACGYAPGEPAEPCGHSHGGGCGFAEALAGTPCAHAHDEACGYVEALAGAPCAHGCEACAPAPAEPAPAEPAPAEPAPVETAPARTVTAFAGLDAATRYQEVDSGDGLDALTLPDALSATVGEKEETIPGVTWACGEYDPEAGMTGEAYVFTAALPEGYRAAEGVATPQILALVDGGPMMAPMAVGDTFTVQSVEGVNITFKIHTEDPDDEGPGKGVVQVGNASTAAIPTGYTGTLTIPAEVANNGKSYTVERVASYAFSGTNVTKIIVSQGVTSISISAPKVTEIVLPASIQLELSAFGYCPELTTVNLPNDITEIRGSCFNQCTSLEQIVIPESVVTIQGYAFSGCTSLNQIVIPKNVSSISSNAFTRCTSLQAFSVASDNQYFTAENGVLFNKDKTSLYIYPAGKTDMAYTVPNSVTEIMSYAFVGNTNLSQLTYGPNVETLHGCLFEDCTGITTLEFTSLTPPAINALAFKNMFGSVTYLQGATIQVPASSLNTYQTELAGKIHASTAVTEHSDTFVAVTDITGVPGTATAGVPLTLTGAVAPDDATNQTITWSVKSAGATGATIVGGNTLNTTASGNVTVTATIANGAAADADFTKDFIINVKPVGTTFTVTVGGVTTTYKILTEPSGGTSGTVQVGDGTNCAVSPATGPETLYLHLPVTSGANQYEIVGVGDNAFSGCGDLKYVVLGRYIPSIGDGAFANCPKLTNLAFFGDTAPTLGSGVFSGSAGIENVMVWPGTSAGYSAYAAQLPQDAVLREGTAPEPPNISYSFQLLLQEYHQDVGEQDFYAGAIDISGTTLTYLYFPAGEALNTRIYNALKAELKTEYVALLDAIAGEITLGRHYDSGCAAYQMGSDAPVVLKPGDTDFTALDWTDIEAVAGHFFPGAIGLTQADECVVTTPDASYPAVLSGFIYDESTSFSYTIRNGVAGGGAPMVRLNILFHFHLSYTAHAQTLTGTAALPTPTTAQLDYDLAAVTYNGSPRPVSVTAKSGVSGLGAITVKYDGSTTAPTGAGSYAVSVDVAAGTGYGAVTGLSLGNYTIAKAPLTITGATVTPKTYNGSAAATITAVAFDGLQGGDSLVLGADYTVSGAAFADADAGTGKAVSGTVALTASARAANYSLANGALPAGATGTINKAQVSGVDQNQPVRAGVARSYPFDLTTLLPGGLSAADRAAVSYAVAAVADPEGLLAAGPPAGALSGGSLALDVAAVAGAGKTATVTITFVSGNYEIAAAVITLTTVDKVPLALSGVYATGGTYSGGPIGYAGTPQLADGAKPVSGITLAVRYRSTDGGGYDSASAPVNAGAYRLTLSVPGGSADYAGSWDFNFTIAQRQVTVRAEDKTATVGGALPAPTVRCTGFVGGDTADTALAVKAVAAHAAGATTAAPGSFAITFANEAVLNGAAGANYTLVHQNGTLTVEAAAPPPPEPEAPRPPTPPTQPPTPAQYPVTAPFGTFTGVGGLSATIGGPADEVLRVLVGGEALAPGHYAITASGGNAVITLSEDYLKTLAAGSYDVVVEFSGGAAEAAFEVDIGAEEDRAAEALPGTETPGSSYSAGPSGGGAAPGESGGSRAVWPWLGGGALAWLLALGAVYLRRRRRSRRE